MSNTAKTMKSFDDGSDEKPGFVYLVHAKGTRRFKIGLTTRSVEQRFAELNGSQSPYPLELLEFIETNDVRATEGHLHSKYSHQRRHGEWFEFSNRQLRDVLREFDRLENGDCGWFRFPTLPHISLPSLPSLRSLQIPDLSTEGKGLLIAGIGAMWLMIGLVACPQQEVNHQQQTTDLTR